MTLPRTGMHGDFAPYHLLKNSRAYYLIDWEYFNPDGSVILDLILLHFHIFNREGDVEILSPRDISGVLERKVFVRLAEALHFSEETLAVLLALFTTCAPLKGSNHLHRRKHAEFLAGIDAYRLKLGLR